jgi:hypothetical protein
LAHRWTRGAHDDASEFDTELIRKLASFAE